MVILGIETSCDETATAIVRSSSAGGKAEVLSHVVASSVKIQQKYGGVVPELAARHQLEAILPTLDEACQTSLEAKKRLKSGTKLKPGLLKQSELVKTIDAIAVTVGPGLIGSLLVGVETAKALALAWDKPLVPVNHLLAHFYACWLKTGNQNSRGRDQQPDQSDPPEFPALGLLVSGGHTGLILMENHQGYHWLGGTRDDAAGEAFDKIARLLGLGYPGGPAIAKAAQKGLPDRFSLPRPMINQDNLDFSFAGLKTSVLYQLRHLLNNPRFDSSTKPRLTNKQLADLAASAQEAIVDVLLAKTKKALGQTKAKSLIVAGGVAANQRLRENFRLLEKEYSLQEKGGKSAGKNGAGFKLFIPPTNLCTDNAAYVAARAVFNYQPKPLGQIQADPSLRLSSPTLLE